ncbi:MAG: hypothetical protein JO290_11185 [Sphingomonadaceae bacterium]|nr:hypothetical protein [Sphingomonadaceae bacterium]
MTSNPRPEEEPRTTPLTPAERATAIGARLRQIFDEAAAEPLPEAFADLLRQLG